MPRETAADRSASPASPGRRQVTALSYDLVGSTRLALSLDPEDLRDLQQQFHQACTRAVERCGGRVDSYAGDGAMAIFGYPVAHEDDAERAVRSALAILEGCRELNAARAGQGAKIAVRVGVATGLVAAGGAIERPDQSDGGLAGFALNLAFKLQSVAPSDTAVVSATTRLLTAGLFEYRQLAVVELPGIAEPQQSWSVVRARRTSTRFEAVRAHRLTPITSRQKELAQVERAWVLARAGQGRAVLVTGEPGIGKSRLALAVKRGIVGRAHFRIVLQCSAQRVDAAFHPVIAELERVIGLGLHRPEEVVGSLRRLLDVTLALPERAMPLFMRLLNLAGPAAAQLGGSSPELLKERTQEVLLDLVEGFCRLRPTLLVVEDAHWLDPTSRELLDALVRRLPGLRLLLLVTARPGFEPAWSVEEGCTTLPLQRLGRRQCVAMIRRLFGDRVPDEATVERIATIAEGVPLFVEELSRSVLDASAAGGGRDGAERRQVDIPATISDLLTARLDRLGPAKELVQVGSAIGRSFTLDLACRVARADEALAAEAMERLVETGLATVQGSSSQRVCTFRHVLIQEAAYQTMLRSVRRSVHRRVAQLFEEEYRSTRQVSPQILAHHYAEAGDLPNAIRNYLEAGRIAASRSENVEAAHLLERGLALLRSLPEGLERDRDELALQVALGPVLTTTRGSGAPEVKTLYDRAVALCGRVPPGPLHFPAYWGWWHASPDFKVMRERAQTLAELAGDLSDEQLLLQAHHCQWATLFNLGEQEACCAHIAAGLELYEGGDYRAHGTLYGGHDPKGCALGEQALSLWLQGFPDASLSAIERCVAHTAGLAHAGSIAHAKDQEIMVRRYRREAPLVLERARAMRGFAAEQRFTDLGAKADLFEGWALATLGRAEAGAGLIERGLDTLRAIGTQEDFPVYYEMLAEAYGLTGSPERGLPLLDEAAQMAEHTGLRYWMAELLRQRGELLLKVGGDDAAALRCFEKAGEVARAQRARALELRAATSKARFLAGVGDHAGAAGSLRPVLAAFSEGFATRDLEDATVLLAGLR